jgi:hypothetical protein
VAGKTIGDDTSGRWHMDQRGGQEPAGPGTAHDPAADRGPTALVTAYVSALEAGDAGLAADLFAEHGLLTSADERITGRAGIAG